MRLGPVKKSRQIIKVNKVSVRTGFLTAEGAGKETHQVSNLLTEHQPVFRVRKQGRGSAKRLLRIKAGPGLQKGIISIKSS